MFGVISRADRPRSAQQGKRLSQILHCAAIALLVFAQTVAAEPMFPEATPKASAGEDKAAPPPPPPSPAAAKKPKRSEQGSLPGFSPRVASPTRPDEEGSDELLPGMGASKTEPAEPRKAGAGRGDGIVVVEQFTSSACPLCGDFARNVRALADNVEAEEKKIFVVSFDIDYANSATRKDPFSRPEWTARQRRYGTFYEFKRIRPPQIFINGLRAGGHDLGQLQGAATQQLKKRAVRKVRLTEVSHMPNGMLRVGYEVSGFLRPRQNPIADFNIVLVHRRFDEEVAAGPLRATGGDGEAKSGERTVFPHTNVALSMQTLRLDKKDAGVVELFPPHGTALDELGVLAFLQDEKTFEIQGADFVALEDILTAAPHPAVSKSRSRR